MDLLEHPLEAVAFRLYSLPIPEAAATGAAAAWTCLAAVLAAAAAAGLWRLRSSTPAAAVSVSTKLPLEVDPSRAAVVSSPEPPSWPSSQRSPPEPAAASTTAPSPSRSPKERYTAYYRDAGCVGCCDEDGDDENEEDDDDAEEHEDGDRDLFVADGAEDPFGWGEMVRPLRLPLSLSPTAAAEMGRRYRRSPTAALSVVQLWDQVAGAGVGGGLTTPTAASPRRRGRVVAGTVVSAF